MTTAESAATTAATTTLPAHAIGKHLLADLHGVAPHLLTDPQRIEQLLLAAAEVAGATPIYGKFHHFGTGQGVTGVLLLQESHISIHTWPEFGFAAVDAFMCGDCRPELAIELLRAAFAPRSVDVNQALRGCLEAKL